LKIFCKHLNKIYKIAENAVEDPKHGWLCPCGCYTNVAPECHVLIKDTDKRQTALEKFL
jgi:hypothetical protein